MSFRRQHAIGNFIVDLVSVKRKLIIELDRSQHLEQAEYDAERSKYLESPGYKVVQAFGMVRWRMIHLHLGVICLANHASVAGVVRVIEVALQGK